MKNIFLDILRLGLGTNDITLRALSEEEWDIVFKTAVKQSLIGIIAVR